MAATQQRPFHSVVFSVSGFPGEFVTEEVAREQVSPKRSTLLPWAVAGSCREKLQRVLERSALKLGRPTLPSEVGMIVCAVTNPASLDEMAAQAAVILNCVRPGLCIHDGTWKSAAYDFADKSQLKKLRNESHLKPVPVVGPKLKRRWPVSYCRELNSYSIPFLGADVSVVKRTQCYLHENLEQSPVQYAAYVTMGGITSIIRLMFAGLFFLFFVRFGIGRPLLVKFPWLFSFGYFSKQGPTQKQLGAWRVCVRATSLTATSQKVIETRWRSAPTAARMRRLQLLSRRRLGSLVSELKEELLAEAKGNSNKV